jgi:hypothetical protein
VTATGAGVRKAPVLDRAAIVLCENVTGLATVRALAQESVDVHCLLLENFEFSRYSRYGRKVQLHGRHRDDAFFLPFLADYCEKLGNRPVVFPCSDRMALFLARHSARLKSNCTFFSNTYSNSISLMQ